MFRLFLTLISGKTLTIYGTKDNNKLEAFSVYPTDDGSITLHSNNFNEFFHSTSGARKEALEKYIIPSQLGRFKGNSAVQVLDVCVGMGYNSACLMEALSTNSTKLNWWGLEIDRKPLKISLSNPTFKFIWPNEIQEILFSILKNGSWKYRKSQGQVLWGDARQQISNIPKKISFDLILLDAFSPSKCPMLWSEEFLNHLSMKLAPGGRLITYSCAAAIRCSLRRSGLDLVSLLPVNSAKDRWSNGTIGISTPKAQTSINQCQSRHLLSPMEEEHLLTRAAIPYRDPSGKGDTKEIIARREKEQRDSKLEHTNAWRRRWKKTS